MSGGGDDLPHRLSDERSQWDMAALIHRDIGMPERRDGIESVPGPTTSEGHWEAEWCVQSAWLRSRVGRQRWGWTTKCPVDDRRHWPAQSSSSRPCWQPKHGLVSAGRVVEDSAVHSESDVVLQSTIWRWQWRVFADWRWSRYVPQGHEQKILAAHKYCRMPILTGEVGIWCCRRPEAHQSSSVFDRFTFSRLARIARRHFIEASRHSVSQAVDITWLTEAVDLSVGVRGQLVTFDQLQQVGDVQQEKDRS